MRLLLVEDDHRIVRFVARGLQEQSYAVDVAANGNDALYQVEINDYDLVILDVMIPGKNGFEVCKAIRALGKRMPILMLTARDAVEDRITGLDSGADDYLTKPFEFGELLARLRALLRRPNELRPSQIIVGDLHLDTASQSAKRGNRIISLTSKEYALLEFLARNAGRVVHQSGNFIEKPIRRLHHARLRGLSLLPEPAPPRNNGNGAATPQGARGKELNKRSLIGAHTQPGRKLTAYRDRTTRSVN